MSVKIEITGGFLKITEDKESPRRFIRAITTYEFLLEGTVLGVKEPQGSNQVTHKYRVDEIINENGDPFVDLDSLDSFLYNNLGSFSIVGGSSTDINSRLSFEGEVYDVTRNDDGFIVDMIYNGDWGVALPPLVNVDEGFRITIIHNQNQVDRGSIVPYPNDYIDSDSVHYAYGNGYVALEKINNEWTVINKSLFSNYHLEGVTKRYDFENETEVLVQHNLGYVPLIEVWIEDEEGGYSRANLDIQHDWNTMKSFNVYIGSSQSGKIIYL